MVQYRYELTKISAHDQRISYAGDALRYWQRPAANCGICNPHSDSLAASNKPSFLLASLVISCFWLLFASLAASNVTAQEIGMGKSPEQARAALSDLQRQYGSYDSSILEPLIQHAAALQEEENHDGALLFLNEAWHAARRQFGLYSESQIGLLEAMIHCEMQRQNWEAVDDYFAYMEVLYTRLYEKGDPRLEEGLQQVSSWHVNAFNTGIDDRAEEHLRAAHQVLQTRLESAEISLNQDDPKLGYLKEGVQIAGQYLRLLNRSRQNAAQLEMRAMEDALFVGLN